MSKPTINPDDLTFKNLVNLLAVYAEAASRLKQIAADLQGLFLENVDGVRAEYAELQAAMTDAETAAEIIARKNPQWFESKRSVKTPYGTIKFHASTKLDVPNEEASIILIETNVKKEEREQYLRKETKLNLDALKKLTDEQLKAFRIYRVADDNFSITAGTIDLGKAVKQAAEMEAA